MSVRAQSSCGVLGTAKSVILTNTPPTPTSITSSTGSYNACIGDTIKYTVVAPVPSTSQSAIVLFRWSLPSKTRIISASTDSSIVYIRFDSLYAGGTLSVKGQTICGVQGTAKSQVLTHTGCAVGTKNIYVKSEVKDGRFEVIVFPNPTKNNFSVTVNADLNKTENQYNFAKIKILDLQGRIIESFEVNLNQKIIDICKI